MTPHDSLFVQPFCVKLWCRDCTGTDPMGCFDGGSQFVYDGSELKLFATLDEAKAAGWDACDPAPWEFDVLDALDRTVFKSVE